MIRIQPGYRQVLLSDVGQDILEVEMCLDDNHEIETASVLGDTMDNITLEHALFSSGHSDENDVQTISHKCLVLRSESSQAPGDSEDNSDHDVYNLVGDYDPLLQQVTLLPPFQQ